MSKWINLDDPAYHTVPRPLAILSVVIGTISAIFGGITCLVTWKMKRKEHHRGFCFSSIVMLGNLVAANWLRGFSNLIGMIRYLVLFYKNGEKFRRDPCLSDNLCTFQSFFSIWFNNVLLICILLIGIFAVYQRMGDKNRDPKIKNKTLAISSVLCWIIPFFFTLVPAIYGKLGEDQSATTNGWCWITSCLNSTSKESRITFMVLYSRGPEALIFMTNLTIYFYLKYIGIYQKRKFDKYQSTTISISTVSEIIEPSDRKDIRKDLKLLFLINLLICFNHIWGIARTVFDIIINCGTPEKYFHLANLIVIIFQALVESLQPSLVFVVLMLCSHFARKYFCQLIGLPLASSNENET